MPKRILKYVVLLVVTANLALMAIVLLGRKTDAIVPLPNPNGYDDFVKAGQMLTGKPEDYKTMTQEELRALVATNAEAFRLVREGLSRKCRVPVEYSTNWFQQMFPAISGFKRLSLALVAEGNLAKLEGRTNDAANTYVECIRLGQESSRGGVVISKLVGIACEAIGREQLRALANSLDAAQCRGIVESLGTIDAAAEPVEETMKQEATWVRKATSFKEKVQVLLQYKDERRMKERIVAKVQGNTLQRRQLMIAFAARAYELEKGKSPERVADLVPAYLKMIPKDPTTGTNLAYLPQ
jgi:hypothetical protein